MSFGMKTEHVLGNLMEGVKKNLIFCGHVRYQGGRGLDPPPAKKIDFFRQNVKHMQNTLDIFLFVKTIFLYINFCFCSQDYHRKFCVWVVCHSPFFF